MKTDQYYQQQNVGTLVSGNMVYVHIRWNSLERERQTTVGWLKTAFYSVYVRYVLGIFRDQAIVVI